MYKVRTLIEVHYTEFDVFAKSVLGESLHVLKKLD